MVHIRIHAGSEGMDRDGKVGSYKYSFAVDVDGYDVKLDHKNYQEFVWATEQEVRDRRCGDAQICFTTPWRAFLVLQSFKLRDGGG